MDNPMENKSALEEMEERLLSCFNGELDEEECRIVERWIEESPEKQEMCRTFLKDCQYIRWVGKEQTIALTQAKTILIRRMRRTRLFRTCYRVAALIVVMVTLGGL